MQPRPLPGLHRVVRVVLLLRHLRGREAGEGQGVQEGREAQMRGGAKGGEVGENTFPLYYIPSKIYFFNPDLAMRTSVLPGAIGVRGPHVL